MSANNYRLSENDVTNNCRKKRSNGLINPTSCNRKSMTSKTGELHPELEKIVPHADKIVNLLPHLAEVAREQRIREKLDEEHKLKQEKINAMPIHGRVYHNVLKKKFEQTMDDDDTVPMRVKERLPLYWSRVVSFSAKLCFWLIVGILTWQNYVADQNTKYVSLENGVNDITSSNYDETSSYRECLTVPNTITDSYKLDANGYWSGQTSFTPGLGKLRFDLNSFEQDTASYTEYMQAMNESIKTEVASGASSRSTPMNLLYLMAWARAVASNKTSHTDYLYFAGDPAYVFNRFFKNAALGSANQQCYAVPAISFERAAGTFTVKYTMGMPTIGASTSSGYLSDSSSSGKTGCCNSADSANDFDRDKECIIAPHNFGYNTMYDATYLSFKYNIWSIVVALGVNLDVLKFGILKTVQTDIQNSPKGCFSLNPNCDTMWPSGLCRNKDGVPVTNSQLTYSKDLKACSIVAGGKTLYIVAKMAMRFPGMDPVYCLTESVGATTTHGCFVRLGTSFALPFANHMGVGSAELNDFYNFRSFCDCSAPDFSNLKSSTLKAFYTNNQHNSRDDFQGSFWSSTYGTTSGYCAKFDLIHGLVLMKGDSQDGVLAHFVQKVINEYTPTQINTMASISGFTAVKTGGNAGSQSSATFTVGSTGGTIQKGYWITALTTSTVPLQVGWYVSVNGQCIAPSCVFSSGLFIQEINEFTSSPYTTTTTSGPNPVTVTVGTTYLKFKLSGKISFSQVMTLVASPINVGNTQPSDHKRAMGTTDSASFTAYQTVEPWSTNDHTVDAVLTQASNKPWLVVSSIDDISSTGNSVGVTCVCTTSVVVSTAVGFFTTTASTTTLTVSSLDSKIDVGDSIVASVSTDTSLNVVGSVIMAIDSVNKILTLNAGVTWTGSGSSPAKSFTVTAKCNNGPPIGATIKSKESYAYTYVPTPAPSAPFDTISGLPSDKVSVGSVVTSVTSGKVPTSTTVTEITSTSATTVTAKVSSSIINGAANLTFTTPLIELSTAMSMSTSDGVLMCSASYATNAYSWCSDKITGEDAGKDCVVLAMQTFDTYDQRINEEGTVPLTSLSCADDFSLSDDALALAYTTPPTSLFQSYYQCFNTKFSSVNVAFGVASGIAGALTPVAVVIMVFWTTHLMIPTYKHAKNQANKLVSRKIAVEGDVEKFSINDDLGDADGDGEVDESELDGFGRVKHHTPRV